MNHSQPFKFDSLKKKYSTYLLRFQFSHKDRNTGNWFDLYRVLATLLHVVAKAVSIMALIENNIV